MIPSETDARKLWDTYNLPKEKRRHVELVAKTALYFAREIAKKGFAVDMKLLCAAALLHDIDKNIPRQPGERHPDTGVRILREEGMDEVARAVSTHSLDAILIPELSPKRWEEKLLYLADKMVKYDIITVDRRFALWRAEHLPRKQLALLDRAYPHVKRLESEVLSLIGVLPEEVAFLA